MKAIFARDIRAGDHIAINEMAENIHVVEVIDGGEKYPGIILLHTCECSRIELPIPVVGGDVLGLIHRPRPVGVTKAQMQDRVLDAVHVFMDAPEAQKDNALKSLREVIEAYELGKSEKEDA